MIVSYIQAAMIDCREPQFCPVMRTGGITYSAKSRANTYRFAMWMHWALSARAVWLSVLCIAILMHAEIKSGMQRSKPALLLNYHCIIQLLFQRPCVTFSASKFDQTSLLDLSKKQDTWDAVPRGSALSLIDSISDTLSQGHPNLQSLVKCLDHRGTASDTVCSQARLC